MKEFKFLHLCDHTFKQTNADGVQREVIVKNKQGSLTDLLINGAVVLDIVEVRALEYTPVPRISEFLYDNPNKEQTYEDVNAEDAYYDKDDGFIIDYSKYFPAGASISQPLPNEFYEPFLHNRIKWNVSPPLKYRVTATILFKSGQKVLYTLEDCSRCQSKGWFVDLLDKNGTFQIATGMDRVIQKVIKALLTKLGTNVLDMTDGTTLNQSMSDYSGDDEKLFDDIRLILSEVEDRLLTAQSEFLDELADDEILVALRVQNIFRSKKNPTLIVLELKIDTIANSNTFRISI